MTDRLYYNDPYLREFDAVVAGAELRERRLLVTLDRSAFYPTTGGQPFDTGTIAGRAVLDVEENDAGDVVHALEAHGAPLVTGQAIHGAIDWARRFDHMQQHTGQHVLSAAIVRLFNVRTVSFHLGAAASTIDIARELGASEIAAAEDLANAVVWEDRPVAIRYASPEEAAAMPLRKEPKRAGTLRLIDVDGFDLSACGGTHVARTGAIGIVVIAGWERFKGGQRLEFLCGGRALAKFRSQRDSLGAAVRLLSVLPEEVAGAVERLQGDLKEQKRAIAALHTELASFRASEAASAAEPMALADGSTVQAVLRSMDADANGLKALAVAVAAQPRHVAVLISSGSPALVVVARSADVALDANALLRSLTAAFGGRGGGKPDLAQGGGLTASAEAILTKAREAIGSAHQ